MTSRSTTPPPPASTRLSELGITAEESEAQDGEAENAREERLRTFADAGYNPIIGVGFAYASAVDKVSKRVPGRQLRDHRRRVDPARQRRDLVFAEEQGSFLVGAMPR